MHAESSRDIMLAARKVGPLKRMGREGKRTTMQQSEGVREAILRCYEVFSAGDVESSMRLLTQEELALGTGEE
jgi:hypothetical protein